MNHFPDLLAIGAIEDDALRHYAATGAVVTLAAQVEEALVAVLLAAGDGDHPSAIRARHSSLPGLAKAFEALVRSRGATGETANLPSAVNALIVPGCAGGPDWRWLAHESSRLRLNDEGMTVESVFESGDEDMRLSTADLLIYADRQGTIRDELNTLAVAIAVGR